MKNIAVIGAGASGIMAALTAAEDKSNKVFLFERQARVGRKLAATGNGRCNLTNTGAAPGNYHGRQPDFVVPALEAFPPRRVIELFEELGLVMTEQYGGRVYPLSDSANSVVDVLRFALEARGVMLITAAECTVGPGKGGGFTVKAGDEKYHCDKAIIACGGKAGGKLGGVSSGYDILRSFGHSLVPLYPALVPIETDSDYPRSLKGIRAEAEIMLSRGGKEICRSRGEIQFTDKGVSGPAAFDISREASTGGGDITINLAYMHSQEHIARLLSARAEQQPEMECGSIFTGILHSRLGLVIVKYCGLKPSAPAKTLSEKDIARLAEGCMSFKLHVSGTGSFENAQVTAGGINTREFDPNTMQSRLVPGLYACGEVLDIDGDCGGYNLQWAWASGALAGRLGD